MLSVSRFETCWGNAGRAREERREREGGKEEERRRRRTHPRVAMSATSRRCVCVRACDRTLWMVVTQGPCFLAPPHAHLHAHSLMQTIAGLPSPSPTLPHSCLQNRLALPCPIRNQVQEVRFHAEGPGPGASIALLTCSSPCGVGRCSAEAMHHFKAGQKQADPSVCVSVSV